jgi:hypothetical protein
MADQNNLMRLAKYCTVEYRQCSRDGIVGDWAALTNAKVISITLGQGSHYNQAEIELSDTRWNASRGVSWGYNIRCRYNNTVLFAGFVVDFPSGYSTAVADDAANPPEAKEYVKMSCLDYRWLYNRCSPVYGQAARGIDDYNPDGSKKEEATFMRGRRCVFNPSGFYNMDDNAVSFTSSVWPFYPYNFTSYVFSDAVKKSASGSPWTAGKAINLLLSPIYNRIPAILVISDPLSLPGLTHADFDTVLDNVIADGLSVVDAVDLICDNIGWTFREQYTTSGPVWVFYKPGMATGSTRVYTESGYNPCVQHTLHTPAVGENLGAADGAVKEDGAKLVCALDLKEDIRPVVNEPWGLAAPHQVEISAELVPAWEDDDLHLPASGTTGLFYTESDLAVETNPNGLDFFKYHHAQGSTFLQDVGRKWALNESGKYTGGGYDRGPVFDFTSVGIDDDYIRDDPTIAYPDGKRLYGPFKRAFKPCLTFDKDSLNPADIRLEWSCDGGTSWQELVCPRDILDGEAAIRLTIPNLAEIVDIDRGTITGGDYNGQEINFFTSLADDKHNSRAFKDGEWNTRVRITATIQMDQRDVYYPATVYNGSPFKQAQVFDFADRYTTQQRCSSSTYYGGALPAWNTNEYAKLSAQMELIRKANEDMAIHGRCVLDRLWIDGTNLPDIMLGDCVTSLTGRNYPLGQTLGSRTVYPEIVEIQYLIQSQKQVLLLRDPRLSIVVHDRQLRRRGK